MKYFLSLFFLCFSFNAIAQESTYEPYKAEYYIGKFKPGKDMGDMVKWANDWAKWADKSGAFENYGVGLMTPYFSNQLPTHDFMWYGRYPDSTEQFAGLQYWVENGGDLLAKLPAVNSAVVEVWQRDISVPEGESYSPGYVIYMDCKLDDGVTGNDVYNAYYTFAQAAKKVGDNLGRKMMWPVTGAQGFKHDFIVVMYANSLSEYGKNNDFWWDKVNGQLPEQQALAEVGYSCENRRSYTSMNIK